MIKKIIVLLLLLAVCSVPSLAAIVIDRSAVEEFDSLSPSQIMEAAGVKIMLRHASVGQCLSGGLDALGESDGLYDRSNFVFQSRGNPGWQAKIQDFIDETNQQAADFDALSMKFCYIDTTASAALYIKAMERLQADHPDKWFVWWTMPVVASGDARIRIFNKTVRAYAKAHDKILFDIASIESHHEDGSACLKRGLESLCPEYTGDGGHPNREGSLRLAKAYWVLASRLSGLK